MSELFGAAFLHVMQLTGDACLSAEGADKGQCEVSVESVCNRRFMSARIEGGSIEIQMHTGGHEVNYEVNLEVNFEVKFEVNFEVSEIRGE